MGKQRLRPSLFPDCAPYLNFLSPEEEYEGGQDPLDELVMSFTAPTGTSPPILECFQRFGFTIVEWTTRDLLDLTGPAWDHVIVREKSGHLNYRQMAAAVKVNKLPGTFSLCRKDQLWNNYRLLQTKWGSGMFSFLPQTFNIPEEWDQLKNAMADSQEAWIAKPIASSCGDGIHLVTSHQQITLGRSILSVQKYIRNPFLINGLKFDLRIYVLLTNIDPIKIYVYEDGIVRFATKPYSMKEEDIADKFIHLTNYSINKRNQDFEFNEVPEELSGHKWSLQMLWKYLEKRGINHSTIWEKIKDIIVKTILCGHHSIKTAFDEDVSSDYNCYKLFGLDVLLDENLKPWLLEVNNFPTLNHKSLDRHVNEQMIAEMFNILGFHITKPINHRKKTVIMDKTGLVSLIEFDPQMYTRNKNKEQLQREKNWAENKFSFFDDDELTSLDVRILMKAEDELEQTVNFSRLFPCKDGQKYLKCCQVQSYSDHLLQAWEEKYGGKSSRGREVLVRLCKEGVHTRDFVTKKISMNAQKKSIIPCS
eukprot:GFUD01003624.1.p1 GENE.GFUD01003624.1~~GFUD01003624.1.p1  ORF type:complete len:534 (+),score=140.74 GFUD01003624.1:66-1667(+)